MGLIKDNNTVGVVDLSEHSPGKVAKTGKTIIYYRMGVGKGESTLSLGLVNTQTICGTVMKSPYGPTLLLAVALEEMTIGTLWLHIVRHLYNDNKEVVE